jgi:hypothetical protein
MSVVIKGVRCLESMNEILNSKDIKVGGRGGFRANAGRKAGSKNLINIKKALVEYMSPQELKNLVERLKRWAKSDKKVAMFIAEQIFGKAKTSANVHTEGKVLHIGAMLDQLEESNIIKIQPNGRETTEQNVEIKSLISDKGQGTKESEIYSESTSATL